MKWVYLFTVLFLIVSCILLTVARIAYGKHGEYLHIVHGWSKSDASAAQSVVGGIVAAVFIQFSTRRGRRRY